MTRQKANGATITVRLPEKAANWVKAHARGAGETTSAVLRRALRDYIVKHTRKTP